MNEIICGFKIRVYYSIPLLFIHSHHKSVLGNTCIIYQDVNMSESGLDLINNPMGCVKVGGIRLKSHYAASQRLDF